MDPALLCRANWAGQLGTGSLDKEGAPAAVSGEHSHFASIAAGSFHTCGVLAGSRQVACFGKPGDQRRTREAVGGSGWDLGSQLLVRARALSGPSLEGPLC